MASSSKSCMKSRPLRSPVWDYFKISGDKKVRCKLCMPPAATTLVHHGGTTSMQSHLSSHLYNYCSLLLYWPIIRYSIVKEATIRIAKTTIRFSTNMGVHMLMSHGNWVIMFIYITPIKFTTSPLSSPQLWLMRTGKGRALNHALEPGMTGMIHILRGLQCKKISDFNTLPLHFAGRNSQVKKKKKLHGACNFYMIVVDSQVLKPLGLQAPLHVYVRVLTVLGIPGVAAYKWPYGPSTEQFTRNG